MRGNLTEILKGKRLEKPAVLTEIDDFRYFYDHWLAPVYRYFYARTGNVRDTEDLTSKAFFKAFAARERYREQGAAAAWLFKIARNLMVDFYRKKPKETGLEEAGDLPDDQLDFRAGMDRLEEIQQIRQVISQLPEDDQELIRLRFSAGLAYKEIGLAVNKSEDAVRKALSRVIGRLKIQMENYHESEN